MKESNTITITISKSAHISFSVTKSNAELCSGVNYSHSDFLKIIVNYYNKGKDLECYKKQRNVL